VTLLAYLLRAEKTEIVGDPRTLSVDKLLDAKFNCTATTAPEELLLLRITWSHDGQPISNDSRHHVTQTMTSHGSLAGQLRVYAVRGPNNGRYECTASNGLDAATSQPAYLLVRGYNAVSCKGTNTLLCRVTILLARCDSWCLPWRLLTSFFVTHALIFRVDDDDDVDEFFHDLYFAKYLLTYIQICNDRFFTIRAIINKFSVVCLTESRLIFWW